MRPFNFHRLVSDEDRQAALQRCEDVKYISGGMTLLPSMKLGLTAPEIDRMASAFEHEDLKAALAVKPANKVRKSRS